MGTRRIGHQASASRLGPLSRRLARLVRSPLAVALTTALLTAAGAVAVARMEAGVGSARVAVEGEAVEVEAVRADMEAWRELVRELRAEVVRLRGEVESLRAENERLRGEVVGLRRELEVLRLGRPGEAPLLLMHPGSLFPNGLPPAP